MNTTTTEAATALGKLAAELSAVSMEASYVSVDLQMPTGHPELVDQLARILLGCEGETRKMGGGDWHRSARGFVGKVSVSVYCGGAEPKEAKRERLAAELEKLDREIAANGEHEQVPA